MMDVLLWLLTVSFLMTCCQLSTADLHLPPGTILARYNTV